MRRIIRTIIILGVTLMAGLPWLLVRLFDPLPAAFHPTQTALAHILQTETANALGQAGPTRPASPTGAALITTVLSTRAPEPSPAATSTATPAPRPSATPAPSATATATPRPQVQVRTLRDAPTYRCPGQGNATGRRLGANRSVTALGRSETSEGVWVLVDDQIAQPQIWLLVDDDISITPEDFRERLQSVACRVTER